MKNKIVFKLILYFSSVLLLFSLIIGILFFTLFYNYSIKVQKADLEKRALSIAETLSNYMSDNNSMGKQNGYGMYLRFLDDIAMADVWIVDENLELLTGGHKAMQYEYSDLPDNAESVVKDVFNGKTTFSEGFSDLLNTATLTVGTPIYDGNEVIGALLLHSPIQGMQEGIKQGSLVLLISMLSALVLSVLLSIYLAFIFTKPLKQLKNTALELANGNYELHTQINRKDEIGDLASSMDILSQQLNTASQQSAQLQKLRDDFIANISHELRTPVTVIRGSLEALCDAVVTDPHMVQNYHRQMLSESIHLQRLVDDLLDLSRLQKTDFDIAMQPISLCDVLSDSVRSAKQMALAKNIEISLQTDHADCSIIGDYGRLRQMFLIVLNNAVKFSYNNSTIEVGMKANTIIIEDHGTGIDEKDLPYIFERFYKSSIIENADGTGLGLAIAKQIADRHAIKIEVQSQPGKGTKFIFSFNNP